MVWLIVLGIIVAIIVLIMLIPVGADLSYVDGQVSVSAKVCGVLIKLLPKKPRDESKPPKEKKPGSIHPHYAINRIFPFHKKPF